MFGEIRRAEAHRNILAVAAPPGSRYASLDALRFVASVGILIYHCLIYASVMGWAARSAATENLRLFVDLFFALSGFVMMHVHGDTLWTIDHVKDFLRRRLARIYPLHALTVVLFVSLGYAVAGTPMAQRIDPVLDPAAALPNLLLIQSLGVLPTLSLNFPSWSVSAEWCLYLLFPFLIVFFRKVSPIYVFAAAVVIILGVAACRDTVGVREWSRATFDFGVGRAVPSFMAGMATFGILRDHPEWRLSWPTALCVVGTLIALMLLQASAFVIVGLAPAVIAALVLAERGGVFRAGLASRLGDLSFGIYLLHALVMIAAAEIIARFVPQGGDGTALLLATTAIVTLPASAVVFRYYEMPMRRLIAARPRPPIEGPARTTVDAEARPVVAS